MRIVDTIPHSHFTISVYSLNEKYIIKIELDRYEQSFKIGESDINGLHEIRNMLNDKFLTNCMKRFIEMRNDFTTSYNSISNG